MHREIPIQEEYYTAVKENIISHRILTIYSSQRHTEKQCSQTRSKVEQGWGKFFSAKGDLDIYNTVHGPCNMGRWALGNERYPCSIMYHMILGSHRAGGQHIPHPWSREHYFV